MQFKCVSFVSERSTCFAQDTSGSGGLAFGDQIEQIEEFREADGGGFGALDQRVAFGAKGGDAEGHGDAVVAAGVDGGAVKVLAAGDIEAIFEFLDFGAHGAKIAARRGRCGRTP